MKLNPPETAPKDKRFPEEILACFNEGDFLLMSMAVWNDEAGKWLVAQRNRSHPPSSFETLFRNDRNMTGWLPMPKIDDRGNVQ